MNRHYSGGRNGGKTVATIQYLAYKCMQLEKALDKACEILRGYTYTDFPKAKADWEKETWKEQLLKEVQEDE